MKKFYLLFIVFLALSLRFFALGSVPVGFHRDEAYLGYNAYSILQTGRDLTGNILPIHLASFLHSPAGYSYLAIPFITLFGLNEFAVRFPSALFGTLTVLVTYFLVKEIFNINSKWKLEIPIVAAAILAISPWHINLSRVATENVVVIFFITLGVFLHLTWIKKSNSWFLFFSFLSFAITLFLYQAPRVFLPVFIPFLFVVFPPKNFQKKLIIPALLFILTIILPIAFIFSSHTLTERIRMLSIFQHPGTQLVLNEQIREEGINNVLIARIFHNKIINYIETFSSNYFAHFSYEFLFTDKGLPDRYRVPQMGLIYFFELPLLLFGLWNLFLVDKRKTIFLSGWILMAPIGSSLTFDDVPNLQRTLLMFPALSIVIAYGFLFFWKLLNKSKLQVVFKILTILIMIYSFLYYLHQYYVHQINHRPWFRQEGYKALMAKLNDVQSNYKKIFIGNSETEPAIFFLFYNKYNPQKIQLELKNQHKDRATYLVLGKYHFEEDPCPSHYVSQIEKSIKASIFSKEKNILFVNGGNCSKLINKTRLISEIKRSDSTIAFQLFSQ